WLIYKYLEDADNINRKRMEEAIAAGDICWHALPFTMHSEVLDASLFALGITLSKALDDRFGLKTVSAKMTDVPGHTRGIVPILQKAGVTLLHVGVNPASTPPDVPPVFIWQAPDDSRVTVMYQKDYGGIMPIPHTSEAVAIRFTGDNHGPQKANQVIEDYDHLQQQFPNADIVASDLNEVAKTVVGVSARLPTVTSELGDSWIHGIGSDPKKIAQLRELSRLRHGWLKSRRINEGSAEDLAFGIPLVKVAEHTWGLDVKTHLQSWDVYTPVALQAARAMPRFKHMEDSWREKRNYIQDAIRTLPEDMNKEVNAALGSLNPGMPDLDRFARITNPGCVIETPHLSLALDPVTGALRQFQNRKTGRQWASVNHPLALFTYQTFSQADYNRFMKQYLTQRPLWALQDFGKPGMEKFEPLSQVYLPRLKTAWNREEEKTHTIFAELEVMDEKGGSVPGCPPRLTTEYSISKTEPTLQITFQWFDKQANRLSEALWLSFVPLADKEAKWAMDKMGQDVDPHDVVKNGGQKLHAVTEGVRYSDKRSQMIIKTLDAPLVAPGKRSLLNFDNARFPPDGGMHFCLFNNVWGTNFVMWFEKDMRFRFTLRG
ncbi:MAG: DUF5054 domain-containing protein, partial [Kiritimatiellia bacterium]|nr:DUF5054 domain-containing protein [Kiritimatiellia bacterium]